MPAPMRIARQRGGQPTSKSSCLPVRSWLPVAASAPGIPDCILKSLEDATRPSAVQRIANPIDSAGELQYFDGPSRARELIAATGKAGVGVLGIRPVQGGALTDTLDRDLPPEHGVVRDFNQTAGLRELASEMSTSTAALAHRYAMSMKGVETVVLGCKNRAELKECVDAANAGNLDAAAMAVIDAVVSDAIVRA